MHINIHSKAHLSHSLHSKSIFWNQHSIIVIFISDLLFPSILLVVINLYLHCLELASIVIIQSLVSSNAFIEANRKKKKKELWLLLFVFLICIIVSQLDLLLYNASFLSSGCNYV